MSNHKSGKNILEHINNSPVIGILTLPISSWLGENVDLKKRKAKSYLPAAWVKWIENSGARVVPIQYNATKPILLSYFSQINGMIICGDIAQINYAELDKDAKLDEEIIRWMKAAYIIFQYATQQNNKGIYFPLLGIGIGYEELVFMKTKPKYYEGLTSSDSALLFKGDELPSDEMVQIADEYKSGVLKFTDTPGIFGKQISKKNRTLWAKTKMLYTTPGWGLNNKGKYVKKLHDFLEINAIGKNNKLKTEFITMYSFKDMPFYGFSFHPEAVIYDWVDRAIPQNDEEVKFSQKLSKLFVNECRKNTVELLSDKILIYNYTLFSPEKVLKLLYPENWQTVQLKKRFTNAYFFGIPFPELRKM